MATTLASGTSTSALTTIAFPAQPAGTLLVLTVTASDVLASSGTGRPESTGWVKGPSGVDWVETSMYARVSAGSETSVQYRIGSANPSAYNLVAYDNGVTGTFGPSSSLHSHNDGSGVAAPGTTAVTPSGPALVVAGFGGSRDGGSSFANPTALTGGFTRQAAAIVTSPDTYANVQGFAVVTGSASTTAPWAASAAKCNFGQLWAFELAAASNQGTLQAAAPTPTFSASGQAVNPGALSATAPRASVAATGVQVNSGTLTASAPRPVMSAAGVQVNPGAVAATAPRATLTASGQATNPGVLSATAPAATFSAQDTATNPGILQADAPRPTLTAVGTQRNPATFTAAAPLPTAAAAGTARNPGVVVAEAPLPGFSAAGVLVNLGSLAAGAPVPVFFATDTPQRPFPTVTTLTITTPTRTVTITPPGHVLTVTTPTRTLEWSTT